jgi:hypothetical protein
VTGETTTTTTSLTFCDNRHRRRRELFRRSFLSSTLLRYYYFLVSKHFDITLVSTLRGLFCSLNLSSYHSYWNNIFHLDNVSFHNLHQTFHSFQLRKKMRNTSFTTNSFCFQNNRRDRDRFQKHEFEDDNLNHCSKTQTKQDTLTTYTNDFSNTKCSRHKLSYFSACNFTNSRIARLDD